MVPPATPTGVVRPQPPLAALALLLLPSFANAEFEKFGEFGQEGGGIFSNQLGGVAVNRGSDDFYVADRNNSLVDRFDSAGQFQLSFGSGVVIGGAEGSGDLNGTTAVTGVVTTSKAFEVGQTIGGEGIAAGTKIAAVGAGTITLSQAATETKAGAHLVVAEGAGNVPVNEVQTVTVDPRAGGGTVSLTFSTPNPSNASATATVPYDASAAEVEAALQGLANIGAGSVAVSGPAGGPWAVEFTGTRFADTDVSQLSSNASSLNAATGAELTCNGGPFNANVSYQWLSNGAPATGAGATTSTYTVAAADAGHALQCRAVATTTTGTAPTGPTGATAVSTGAIAAGTPSGAFPGAPFIPIAAPAVPVGGFNAGNKLVCVPGTWTGSPTFTYQWYRNGVALVGNGAESSEYTLQAADLTSAASFQCGVTGTNADGAVVKVSANRVTAAPAPVPSPAAPNASAFVPSLSAAVATTQAGAAAPEVCTSLPDCKAGVSGTADGEFVYPVGVAVDQASGHVFVVDASTSRETGVVQEFTADGAFLSSFGERGSASPEQIERLPGQTNNNGYNSIAVAPDGTIYLVDEGTTFGPRVMVFSPAGAYERSIGSSAPEGYFEAKSVAVDDAGNVYVSGFVYVFKFSSSGDFEWLQEDPNFSLRGMTVNPVSEEVFYYSQLRNTFRRLNPDGTVAGEFPGEAGQKATRSLAINPELVPPGLPVRPEGVIYGADSTLKRGLVYVEAPLVAPTVKSQTVAAVGETSASLKATINPNGGATSYVFQYGTAGPCDSNPCAEAPLGGGQLAGGKADLTAGATLTGLAPDTTYYFRVLASNGGGPGEGPAGGQFSTFPVSASGLPDGRAYELVSPAEKPGGGQVIPPEPGSGSCPICGPNLQGSFMAMQAAPDGNAIAYEGEPFFAGITGRENEYLSSRAASGWQTKGLTLPLFSTLERQGFRAFSSDLGRAVVVQAGDRPISPAAPVGYENLYLWQQGGALQPLIAQAPPGVPSSFRVQFGGANAGTANSSGFSHLLFAANAAVPGATPPALEPGTGNYDLYEWVGGQLNLVNVLPGGAVATGSGVYFGSGGSPAEATVDHAISDDGSRVFWTDSGGQSYVRIDGTETRSIEDPGTFLTASPDGSTVLLDNGHLYDVATESAVDLTGGAGGFEGTLGTSDDLTRVYFVDTEVLSGGEENANHEVAEVGKDNLYLWEGSTPKFIGALLPGDNKLESGTWSSRRSSRTAQVSPDGRYLAFNSKASLTGFENFGPTCTVGVFSKYEPGACAEAFVYDATAQKLSCASCNPTGRPPAGPSKLAIVGPRASARPCSPSSAT